MSVSPRRVVSAESTRCSGTVFPECKQDYSLAAIPPRWVAISSTVSIPKSISAAGTELEGLSSVQVFERFTDRARRVVVLAQEEARMLNHNYIGTEHILLGLVRERDGVAAKALDSLNIRLDAVRREVEEIIGQGQAAPTGHIPFTPRAKKVLELSLREALQLGHNYIGTEHILLGLIREGEGVAAQVLQKLGADLNRVRQTVIQILSGYATGAELRKAVGSAEMAEMEEQLGSEIAPTAVPSAEDAPMCPNCFAAFDETLAVRELETTAKGESLSVRIAYCGRCGVALGTVA
jgi:Clp amino terminal domain, pathogenicity island component